MGILCLMMFWLETLNEKNQPLFFFGSAMIFGACLMLVCMLFSDKQVLGISAFLKPLKFFVSIWLMVWTLAWYLQYLDNQVHVRWFSWATILAMGYEMVIISMQAFRGRLSHFNMDTPWEHALFVSMGVVITIFTLWLAYMGYLFFVQSDFNIDQTLVWGIRIGIFITVIFAFEGGLMGSRLQHSVGGPDGGKGLPLLNWSRTHGDLRIAHFVGLHALQIIPLFSFLIARNVFQVVAFSGIFLLVAIWIFMQALGGKPLV